MPLPAAAPLAHLTDQEHASGDDRLCRGPDAESAIGKATKEFDINDPHKQRRLVAQLHR
jgi:hypothetical protein